MVSPTCRSSSSARARIPGTFDYFTLAINGREKRSRSDYLATEDDNVTVQGVSGERGGMGYFGVLVLRGEPGTS